MPTPTIIAVSVPDAGLYTAGDTLSFAVTFSESVICRATVESIGSGLVMSLVLDIGGVFRSARTTDENSTSGTAGTVHHFNYTVEGDDLDDNGIEVVGLNLNGWTIFDELTELFAANTTLNNVGDTSDVLVAGDTTPENWMTLFVRGMGNHDDSTTLFTIGGEPATGSLPLSLPVTRQGESDQVTLYVRGWDAFAGDTSLMTAGHESADDSLPLFIGGVEGADRGLLLYLRGDEPDTTTSSLLLTVRGSTEDGSFAGIPLFAYSDEFGQTPTRAMPLFLSAENQSAAVANMNLWVNGRAHAADGSLELVVWNDQLGHEASIPLFVRGDGVTEGAVPANHGMNLVLQRNPAQAIPLYVQGPGEELTEVMTLFVSGNQPVVASLDLSLPEAVGFLSRVATLYTSGF